MTLILSDEQVSYFVDLLAKGEEWRAAGFRHDKVRLALVETITRRQTEAARLEQERDEAWAALGTRKQDLLNSCDAILSLHAELEVAQGLLGDATASAHKFEERVGELLAERAQLDNAIRTALSCIAPGYEHDTLMSLLALLEAV